MVWRGKGDKHQDTLLLSVLFFFEKLTLIWLIVKLLAKCKMQFASQRGIVDAYINNESAAGFAAI
jgi:hypothetical protein